MIPNELLDQFASTIAEKVAAKLMTSRPSERRLLTAKEAATYLGRSLGAIQHLTAAGDLPTVRTGRRVHYDVRDLDNWISGNRV